MTAYRRSHIPGATWFFTVKLAERRGNTRLVEHIDILRTSFARTRARHPFRIEAIVVLPDHLHSLWRLPPGEADYATRWALIKAGFSRALPAGERFSRRKRGERDIWQRFLGAPHPTSAISNRHANYVHYNAVKHGDAPTAAARPQSSFRVRVAKGIYPPGWAGPPAPLS